VLVVSSASAKSVIFHPPCGAIADDGSTHHCRHCHHMHMQRGMPVHASVLLLPRLPIDSLGYLQQRLACFEYSRAKASLVLWMLPSVCRIVLSLPYPHARTPFFGARWRVSLKHQATLCDRQRQPDTLRTLDRAPGSSCLNSSVIVASRSASSPLLLLHTPTSLARHPLSGLSTVVIQRWSTEP
jgi:hypothetical protein